MKQKISLGWLMSFAVVMLMFSCAKDKHIAGAVEKLPNTVVLEWNEIAFQAFGGPAYQHSLMASRINAMTHIAMHDALNAIQPQYETYAYNGKRNVRPAKARVGLTAKDLRQLTENLN